MRNAGRLVPLVVLLVLVLVVVVSVSPPTQASSAPPPPVSRLTAIRSAYHKEVTPNFDRVVFDFTGPVPLVDVEYVDQLIQDASGFVVPVNGDAILQVRFTPAYAHTDAGYATAPGYISFNHPLVKEVVRAGDHEAIVTYGIGVVGKPYFRVFTLARISRVVIDFKQP